MPDAARYAAMSWPDRNYHFRRGWAEPPPQDERSRGAAATTLPASFVGDSNGAEDNLSLRTAQRAFAWERAADHELALGHVATAERLSRLAAELREAVG